MYGYSFDRPARHMREYLSVLLPLLGGEHANFAGETLRASIGLSTPRAGRVPVLLAAMAPQMLRLAGERTDGTVLWMTGPATVRDYVVPTITAAAQAAGRPSPRVVCILPVCVTDDAGRGPGPRDQGTGDLRAAAVLPRDAGQGRRQAGPGDVTLVGDEAAVAAQVSALAEAGVTDFVAVDIARGEDRDRTRSLLKKVIAASLTGRGANQGAPSSLSSGLPRFFRKTRTCYNFAAMPGDKGDEQGCRSSTCHRNGSTPTTRPWPPTTRCARR